MATATLDARPQTIMAADDADDGRHLVYWLRIVKPIGRFSKRDPLAVPAKFEPVKDDGDWHLRSRKRVQEDAVAYNKRSKNLNWNSWAVIVRDDELAELKARAAAASMNEDHCRGAELKIHFLRPLDDETKFTFIVELHRWTDVEEMPGDVRTAALEVLRKSLRELESQAKLEGGDA
jgi:hypothetical protein